jgi:hypothetical protein
MAENLGAQQFLGEAPHVAERRNVETGGMT